VPKVILVLKGLKDTQGLKVILVLKVIRAIRVRRGHKATVALLDDLDEKAPKAQLAHQDDLVRTVRCFRLQLTAYLPCPLAKSYHSPILLPRPLT
jgi:hypothetical protein|tara:strand:+ start:299 stop:583 length:285 start_codon:yes stop_codon:yes gene_type:complete